ncbi:MAG: helix-turn-helix transcriptional regulator [Acidobacteriota bacterium]|nr:helix-turn-helix transcriptional regulator [Acidobacteriota bacterium]
MFVIGERLRMLRETKGMPQSEIERRTGLLRCYVSRVENGHTVPSIETLEKLARALEVPLYQLFYDQENPTTMTTLPGRKTADEIASGADSEQRHFLHRMAGLLERLSENDRRLLLHVAQRMADQ